MQRLEARQQSKDSETLPQAAQKRRPEGSHCHMAAKKRERHGQMAAIKVMLERHGQMAAHMPRLEGRQKSKDSET
jgi:hypothetical protein